MSIARHTIYNFAGSAAPLLVSIATVPLYIGLIGLDRYGLLAIFWLLIGYFTIFDFGIGKAAMQRISALNRSSPSKRSRIFWTALGLTASLSMLAMLFFVPIGWIGLRWFSGSGSSLTAEVRQVFPLLVVAVPIPMFQGLLVGALNGRLKFRETNLISSAGAVLTAVLPLAAARYVGAELLPIFSAVILSRLLVLAALAITCRRQLLLEAPQFTSPSEIRRMIRFGGWLTISNLIGPFLVFADRFVIGALLGATAVGIYTIPFNLVTQLWILPGAIASALFPRLASASGDEADRLLGLALSSLLSILLPVTAVLLVCAKPGLVLWLGNSTGLASAPIGIILLLGFWINSLAQMPFARLQSAGRTDVIAKIHLVELIPFLTILYFLTQSLGLIGAAIAWNLRVLVDFAALAWTGRIARNLLYRTAAGLVMLTTIAGALMVDTTLTKTVAMILTMLTIPMAILLAPSDLRSILIERSKSALRLT